MQTELKCTSPICEIFRAGRKNVLVPEAQILLLSVGDQHPSQSHTENISAVQATLLKKMQFFMLNPLVQVSGSISTICLRKS